MYKAIAVGLALSIGEAATWAQTPERLDLKTGLWKVTSTSETTGQPPIPQDVLDRLTPEQKARMEQNMRAGGGPKTVTHQHCVTESDLDKLNFGRPDNKSCSLSTVRSTSTVQEASMNCAQGPMKTDGTIHIEAVDREHVRGSVKMTMSNGPRTMNMNVNLSGTWIAPTCSAADNH